jgi:hypothetical protein
MLGLLVSLLQPGQPLPVRIAACQCIANLLKRLPEERVAEYVGSIVVNTRELVLKTDVSTLPTSLRTLLAAMSKSAAVRYTLLGLRGCVQHQR